MEKNSIMYEVGLVAAGLMGALVLIGNKAPKSLKAGLVALLSGCALAYFITPVFIIIPFLKDLSNATGHRADYAVSFVLGTIGWSGVEMLRSKGLKLLKKTSKEDENHDNN
jgi:hypothetical protein